MSAEIFQSVVNQDTVYGFGIPRELWSERHQADLHECMILLFKENPDWTHEQATDRCREEVYEILWRALKQTYGLLVLECTCYKTYWDALDDLIELGRDAFERKLNENVEYARFCNRFYETLRARSNICSAGMWDEFQKMKTNNWTQGQYASYLRTKRGQ